MFHDGTVFRSGSELTVFALERAISIVSPFFQQGGDVLLGCEAHPRSRVIGLLLHSIRVVVSSFRVVKVP